MTSAKVVQSKSDANRSAFKYLELVVVGIGVNLISNLFNGPWWVKATVLFIVAFVGLLVFGLMPGGWLRREVHGGKRGVRWLGVSLLVLYLPVCLGIILLSPPNFLTAFIPLVLFTLLIALVGWQTLRGAKSAIVISTSVTTLLAGAGALLLGATVWNGGHSLGAWAWFSWVWDLL